MPAYEFALFYGRSGWRVTGRPALNIALAPCCTFCVQDLWWHQELSLEVS